MLLDVKDNRERSKLGIVNKIQRAGSGPIKLFQDHLNCLAETSAVHNAEEVI